MTKIINPIEYKNWNKLILSSEDYSFFHTSTWAEILQKSYGYKPLYFTLDEQDKITAVLPIMEINSPLTGKRGVSLPFSDYCEPIVQNADQFPEIFTFIIDYGKKEGWKYIEIRGGNKFFEKHEPSDFYFGHNLDLSAGVEKIFSNLRDSTKRNIKKAIKEKIQVAILDSHDSMDQFFRLNCVTRRDHGLPPQPYKFFKYVYDEIISKRLGFISIAYLNNNAIAGNVFFLVGEKVIYKYGASDRNYQHLRANNLVMWDAIKWCCEKRYKYLCFGRTEPENGGLRQFKSGWGAKENFIKYYKYDFHKNSFVKESSKVSDFQHKIFNKLPIPILNIISNLLYRHVG